MHALLHLQVQTRSINSLDAASCWKPNSLDAKIHYIHRFAALSYALFRFTKCEVFQLSNHYFYFLHFLKHAVKCIVLLLGFFLEVKTKPEFFSDFTPNRIGQAPQEPRQPPRRPFFRTLHNKPRTPFTSNPCVLSNPLLSVSLTPFVLFQVVFSLLILCFYNELKDHNFFATVLVTNLTCCHHW